MEAYAKQMIDFQKTTFDKTFNTIVKFQDQAEKMTYDVIGQLPWVTEEGRKAMDDSVKMFKNVRDDYKKVVTDGFERMEEVFIQ
jgi:hypothetical protein